MVLLFVPPTRLLMTDVCLSDDSVLYTQNKNSPPTHYDAAQQRIIISFVFIKYLKSKFYTAVTWLLLDQWLGSSFRYIYLMVTAILLSLSTLHSSFLLLLISISRPRRESVCVSTFFFFFFFLLIIYCLSPLFLLVRLMHHYHHQQIDV